MTVPFKADRMKTIKEGLENPALKPFQTKDDKQAIKGKKARRKGESFQKLIAADLQKIGRQFGFDQGYIYSGPVTSRGMDIFLDPYAWKRFGRLSIECKHYKNRLDAQKIFKQHAQKCGQKLKYGFKAIPMLVHRCDYQPILVTMRKDDMMALSEKLPESRVGPEKLVTVPWEEVLQLLSRKVAESEPVFEVEEDIAL